MAIARERLAGGRRDKPRKGDLRERAILDTAERLLAEAGSEAMTVESIATGAGLSRASLYFYFASKQEVLTALVARTMTALADSARAAADDVATTPQQSIRRAMKDTERQWREHGDVMRAAVELSPTVPAIDQLWTETLELHIASFTAVLLRAGLSGGTAARGAPAMARALCWATERNFYLASADPQEKALRRATAVCTELWLSVIEAAAAR